MDVPLTPWKRGDPFSAGHLNELVDGLGKILPLGIGDGVEGGSYSKGSFLSAIRQSRIFDIRLGIVVAAGPGGAADLTGCMYWVKLAYPSASTDITVKPDIFPDPPAQDDSLTDSDPFINSVINLAEYTPNTHTLITDGTQKVVLFGLYDDSQNKVWLMSVGGATSGTAAGMFKIQANETGANVYTGGLVTPKTSDISTSTDLSISSAGTDPSGGSTDILLDFGHMGYSGHSLSVGQRVPVIYWRTQSDGKNVWACGFDPGTPGSDYHVLQWFSGKLISATVKVST